MPLTRLAMLAVILSMTVHLGCVEQSRDRSRSNATGESQSAENTFTGTLGVGDTVPALRIPELLQSSGPESITLEELKGSTVVLEFWATWCPPCRDAIPHMNELVDTFADDENVRFISITDESEPTVRNFLKRNSMHSWIGLDTSSELHRAFEVHAIPQAIIIDSDGKVAEILHPVELDAQRIREIHKPTSPAND